MNRRLLSALVCFVLCALPLGLWAQAAPAGITITTPQSGAVVSPSTVSVTGTGTGLPDNAIVVRALDAEGTVLGEQPTAVDAAEAGGAGAWEATLSISVVPGTTGTIVALSSNPEDGAVIASAEVPVTFGEGAPQPTAEPTEEPVPTPEPSEEPIEPTEEPTEEPIEPTEEPTEEPIEPTEEPTEEPIEPTEEPTEEPIEPTEEPTEEPIEPTEEPTEEPIEPTEEPTEEPIEPTEEPTEEPIEPTEEPTEEPIEPTEEPTEEPIEPTEVPTEEPIPTSVPTEEPTQEPEPAEIVIEIPIQDELVSPVEIVVAGEGQGLPENNVVVHALDAEGNILDESATIVDADLGARGEWRTTLRPDAAPGTVGKIVAFSGSPKDGAVIAVDDVDVRYGPAGGATPTATPTAEAASIRIIAPRDDAIINADTGFVVAGTSRNLFENNVVVEVRDADGRRLTRSAMTAEPNGDWTIVLYPGPTDGDVTVRAFSPSPADGGADIEDIVKIRLVTAVRPTPAPRFADHQEPGRRASGRCNDWFYGLRIFSGAF